MEKVPFYRTRTFRILLFLFMLILFDLGSGLFLRQLLAFQKDGRYYKMKYSIEDCHEDIIILGSSRAETNYNPAVFREKLGMTCWNAGRGGQGTLYWSLIQNEILDRYRPKMFIINIDQDALETEVDYDHAAILKPFARGHPYIFQELSKASWAESAKMQSSIYNYNSSLFFLIRPLVVKDRDGKASDQGWKPKFGKRPESFQKKTLSVSKPEPKPVNPGNKEVMIRIIDRAVSDNIPIVLVVSPETMIYDDPTPTLEFLNQYCRGKNVRIIDFTHDPAFKNNDLFYDMLHLNADGADLLSAKLADTLVYFRY